MSMLNVLSIVSYRFLPAQMGGQKAIALFNQYLAGELTLACIGTKSNTIKEGIPYELIPLLSDRPLRYINPAYFFSIKRLIRLKKASHVILEHPYYGWLGFLLKKYTGIKLVVHSHNIESERFRTMGKWWWKLLYHYEKWAYRTADHVFLITPEDQDYAINRYGVAASKTTVITYGTELGKAPSPEQRKSAAATLRDKHQIPASDAILLFNGTFSYQPNRTALYFLLDTVVPALTRRNIAFSLIICGKGIPDDLTEGSHSGVIFAGFVESIDPYLDGSTLFVNPISEGGGIKTKLVEALSHGLPVVSFRSGARGITPGMAGDMLFISPDNDADTFINNIVVSLGNNGTSEVPEGFYDHFHWTNIAKKAAACIGA